MPKLKRYMDDLQRLAREGNVKLDIADVTPRELAEQVVSELAGNPKWRTVEFSASGEAREIVVDANLVKRAIYNLCSNGADACASLGKGGSVVVEVKDADVGDVLEISVRDTGGGMAAQKLQHLLEGDFTSTKRSTGVGLGFGVARHVAHAHGGKIEGKSAVGDGSVFTLVLPRQAPQDGREERKEAGARELARAAPLQA